MRKLNYIIVIALSTLIFVNSLFGQKVDVFQEEQIKANQVLAEKIKQATLASKAAGELQIKLNNGDKNAALDAVKLSCDPTLIPLLELYADNGRSTTMFSKKDLLQMPWMPEWYQQHNGDADVALAKCGRTEYLTRILNQTDKSKDIYIRYEAVRKLGLIGNKVAYSRLLELLDDTVIPISPSDDVGLVSMADLVVDLLGRTVSDPPNTKGIYDIDKQILLWKKWFEEHKDLTEGAEKSKCDVVSAPVKANTDNLFTGTFLFTDYVPIAFWHNLF